MKRLALLLALLLGSDASGQMFPGPGSTTYRSINYLGNMVDAADLTTYTFTGYNFGTAATGRVLVAVCVGAAGNRTISSSTIGGVAGATQVEVVSATNGTAAIISAAVPTGTSGDISITWSGAQGRAACGLWSMYGITSATAANTSSDGTAGSSTLSLSVQANDLLVVGDYINTGSATPTGYNSDFEVNIEAATKIAGGRAYVTTAQNPRTVTIAYSGAPAVSAAVAAVFR